MQIDIAWAAGLFEGEGCVSSYIQHNDRVLVTLALKMVDEDVVRHFGRVVEIGKVYGPMKAPSTPEHWQSQWFWQARGWRALHHIHNLFGPYLGARRSAKFEAVLATEQAPLRNSPGASHCRVGHPFSGDNLITSKDGKRRCRACKNDWAKRRAVTSLTSRAR